jgi:hypothetical protein
MTTRMRKRGKKCISRRATINSPLTEDQRPLLIEGAGTDLPPQSVALVCIPQEKARPTRGWKGRFCSFMKSLFTLTFLTKACARQESISSLTSTEPKDTPEEKDSSNEEEFQSPVHQEEQHHSSEKRAYVYNTAPPPIPIPDCNVKDLFRPVLPDIEFAEKSIISTRQAVPVPYLQKENALCNIPLHKVCNHLGRCLNVVLSYSPKSRIIPGCLSMETTSSDPIDSCKSTLFHVKNNLPACAELFGFDDPESLNEMIEKILSGIPKVWNCEEDSEIVIEIMTTQQTMVRQVADSLGRQDESMMEITTHLRKVEKAMERDIQEARDNIDVM